MSKSSLQQRAKVKIQRPGLSNEEIEEIRQAFELFDSNGEGKLDPKELISSMKALNYDKENPTMYNLLADLETFNSKKNERITFDEYVTAINAKLRDSESKEGVRRIFDMFIDDPNSDTININSLRKVALELGENMSNDDLKDMLERTSTSGKEITFDEFYEIMTKKSFP
jgi:Ca2+-binding EF-hand superfamily protein